MTGCGSELNLFLFKQISESKFTGSLTRLALGYAREKTVRFRQLFSSLWTKRLSSLHCEKRPKESYRLILVTIVKIKSPTLPPETYTSYS